MAADDREIVPELDVVVSLPGVESFEGFYAREYRLLVAFAHALTGSRAHAEDVAQEAMLARTEQQFARSRDAVSHLLTSEQLETYKQMQDAELAMQRAQIRLQRANMEAAMREGRDVNAFFGEAVAIAQPLPE